MAQHPRSWLRNTLNALWAVQRAYTTGDMRYYDMIHHKVGMVWERAGRKRPTCYNRKRPFETLFKFTG